MWRVCLRAVELHSLGRYACGKGGRDAVSAESATKMLAHPLPPDPLPTVLPPHTDTSPELLSREGGQIPQLLDWGQGNLGIPENLKLLPPTLEKYSYL